MKYKKKVWFVLPMRCLLFLAVFCFCSIITGRSLTEITHWWSVIASIINVVTIVVLLVICRCEGTTYLEMIRFERKQGNILEKSRIMAAVYLIVIMLLMGMGGMYMAGWLCYGEFPYLAPLPVRSLNPYKTEMAA